MRRSPCSRRSALRRPGTAIPGEFCQRTEDSVGKQRKAENRASLPTHRGAGGSVLIHDGRFLAHSTDPNLREGPGGLNRAGFTACPVVVRPESGRTLKTPAISGELLPGDNDMKWQHSCLPRDRMFCGC